jgi:16S rRNA (guanine966-N2)-methyltransferase|uniref:16S rRNA (guanine(966)-N(2))-methyltransferase RsmD n=1 Tax=Cyanobium sp. TaxID=2164130 RepID=UPI004048CD6D
MTLRISGGRKLLSPPGEIARPTASRVRLAVMNLLAPDLPGCRWLDLCCGSGVMACEAIQRGADAVVAIEQDRRIAAIAKANLEAVAQGSPGESHFWVHCSDVKRWLARGAGDGAFDLIYADPPYAAGLYGAIAAGVSRGGWLKPNGVMVWECATTKPPNLPTGWQLADQRRYGSTSVMILRLDSAVEDGAATVLVPGRHE